MNFKAIIEPFAIHGNVIDGEPYGNGHINDTYVVRVNQGGTVVRYLLQRINHFVFKNPEALMENILRVTDHLGTKLLGTEDSSRRTLTIIPTRQGKAFFKDGKGNYWRVYIFVERALSCEVLQTPDQAYQAARAFGRFQKNLVDLPQPRLHEVIPGFHHTPQRYQNLLAAIKDDVAGRKALCLPEIDFALEREIEASRLIDMQQAGALPERITHNDTKLNNVLMDTQTGEGVCVIDLDTVMPGLVHYDFGDMVRTASCKASEDETNPDKVCVQFDFLEALLKGYIEETSSFLTEAEKEMLPFSGKLITLEIGVRFLTDFLQGDVYFKTHRHHHNLDRCRNQFLRVRSLESQMDDLTSLLGTL